jgi:hypothetical protein
MTTDDNDGEAMATLGEVLESQGWTVARGEHAWTLTAPERPPRRKRKRKGTECMMLSEMPD